MSAEDPALAASSSSRAARASPAHQRNGHGERSGSTSGPEETRRSTRQTHPEHLNTGPALQHGPSPLLHSLDSEGEQARRPSPGWREPPSLPHVPGIVNGPQQEQLLGRARHRDPAPSSRHSFYMSYDLDEPHKAPQQTVNHRVDFSGPSRERHGFSPLVHNSDPVHQPSYAELNGFCSVPFSYDEGRNSPALGRSPRLHSPLKPDPGQGQRPVLSRAERMAALERRMVANGLAAPGRAPRSGLGRRRPGPAGAGHVGAVQMSDCSTTSGSESSESEVEAGRAGCSSPLPSGEAGSASNIPRNKFSFGSLQLDEEADEDGGQAFSDEEGAQIFSC